jgi:hypothetical protein
MENEHSWMNSIHYDFDSDVEHDLSNDVGDDVGNYVGHDARDVIHDITSLFNNKSHK